MLGTYSVLGVTGRRCLNVSMMGLLLYHAVAFAGNIQGSGLRVCLFYERLYGVPIARVMMSCTGVFSGKSSRETATYTAGRNLKWKWSGVYMVHIYPEAPSL